MRILTSMTLLIMFAVPAKADRPVADAEKEKLVAAVAAQGCSGGEMEWDDDDQEFEVKNAQCSDGRYELEFDAQFALKKKKRQE